MKLHRLRAVSFAGIRDVDIEFGPGLNVLYGPNDLGKSTLVAAIRLALLLPYASSHSEQYVGWTGGEDPLVEMTFETEAQRIWRVRKVFGSRGSALLQESKNGRDFDDVERGRKVDGKLREILRWGIPEPGGSGGGKGLPASFLATALLSTQADVAALLSESLQNDPSSSGKEQITRALQAVAQDPLFISLLREVQARRDKAYTDKGAKKQARGSVFKDAAERVNETRQEKDRLLKIVADSEGAERQIRDLTDRRIRKQEELSLASERLTVLERLAAQAAERAEAAEQVRLAREEVARIEKLGQDVDDAQRTVAAFVQKVAEAEAALKAAQIRQNEANLALTAAEDAARAEESDKALTETVARQEFELRKSAADRAASEAQQRIDAIAAAQKLVDAAATAEWDLADQKSKAAAARDAASRAAAKQRTAADELDWCGLLERALDVLAADKQAAAAQASVNSETVLQARLQAILAERAALVAQRSAITVPTGSALIPMRKLATELAAARGALDVGLVVTVSPYSSLDLRVRKDRSKVESITAERLLKIEARTEVEVNIAEVATLKIRGGRPETQERAQALEDRWSQEVAPHLAAAGVTDIEALDLKVAVSRELDSGIKAKDAELESLRAQIAALSGASEALKEASRRAAAARVALTDTPLDSMSADLAKLGADPAAGLRKRRDQLSQELEAARTASNLATNAQTLADERTRNSQSAYEAALAARNAALASFPEGLDAALTAAKKAIKAAAAEKDKLASEIAKLDSRVAAKKTRIDAALSGARTNAENARAAVEVAQRTVTTAIANHASQNGQLIQLQRMRDAEDASAAKAKLQETTERHAALPVPVRIVTEEDVAAAKNTAANVKAELELIERGIFEAQGALKHVGGAVARERLRDAAEAFDAAESYEREIEAEYESWKLLLEQMKEADAAQASNLGQALAPVIADRFQKLTQRRYENVQLTAQLGTEGVVAAGAVRSTASISVGTREQLSTLYRLSLAEYLQTVIVLDDQLVQSDGTRMDWFRTLLVEKARSFQIVVVTCRPADYLAATAMVPEGEAVHADSDAGFTRAIDLARAVHRR